MLYTLDFEEPGIESWEKKSLTELRAFAINDILNFTSVAASFSRNEANCNGRETFNTGSKIFGIFCAETKIRKVN